ncbi:type IV pilin [Halococcoides cellulosivorans]|uniref:Type IV pilin n=1 Tax=Halococcoides cellulosivorans TaxID=1679096 RepID=A0A2R4X383_9EURY|nr:type IV pilin [Halococcoides cellulosivorans]AWB28247.1 type IV pilin [Halococcoides cellulosivorans]
MDRATSPVVGSVVLIVLTVVLAGSVAAAFGSVSTPAEPRYASIDGSVDADTDQINLIHRRGDPLDVDDLDLRLSVDGEPVTHQPDVPFNGTVGFTGAPEGPFNAASADRVWRAGDRAGFELGNNTAIDAGDTVTVTISHEGYHVATVETTAT